MKILKTLYTPVDASRYRARIIRGAVVGVMDLQRGEWVRAEDGEVVGTDVGSAESLAALLNETNRAVRV